MPSAALESTLIPTLKALYYAALARLIANSVLTELLVRIAFQTVIILVAISISTRVSVSTVAPETPTEMELVVALHVHVVALPVQTVLPVTLVFQDTRLRKTSVCSSVRLDSSNPMPTHVQDALVGVTRAQMPIPVMSAQMVSLKSRVTELVLLKPPVESPRAELSLTASIALTVQMDVPLAQVVLSVPSVMLLNTSVMGSVSTLAQKSTTELIQVVML